MSVELHFFLYFCECIIRTIRTAERYLLLERGKETERRVLKERVLKRIYLLKEIKEKSSVPLLTKAAECKNILSENDVQLLEESTFASNLYEGILSLKSGRNFVHEYQKPVVIV